MKQFSTVFKFELMAYFKNKAYIIASAIMLGMGALIGLLPLIIALIAQASFRDTPPIAVYDEQKILTSELVDNHLGIGKWVWLEDTNIIEEAIIENKYTSVLKIDGLQYTVFSPGSKAVRFNPTPYTNLVKERYILLQLNNKNFTAEERALIIKPPISPSYIFVGRNASESQFAALILIVLLYVSISIYGGYITSSVVSEKTSKIIEVLIISIKPSVMICGKVLAAGCAGLLQIIGVITVAGIVSAAGLAVIALTGISVMDQAIQIQEMLAFSSDSTGGGNLIFFALTFFTLGFFTFSFLYAAVGSLASSMDDLKSISTLPALLSLPGYMIAVTAAANISAPHIIACSFIPFLSPMVMFSRIAMSNVPPFQIFLSIVINIAAIVLISFASAKIYRMGVLLYGVKPTLTNIFKYLNTR